MKQQLSYQMGGDLSAESYDSIEKFVFSDLQENLLFKRKSLDEHYDYVMSTLDDYYLGVSKYVYGNILQAIKAIVNCKINHLKTPVKSRAIGFLHQEMRFSPAIIQDILLLFDVKIGIPQILKDSGKVFANKPVPAWIQRFFGGVN